MLNTLSPGLGDPSLASDGNGGASMMHHDFHKLSVQAKPTTPPLPPWGGPVVRPLPMLGEGSQAQLQPPMASPWMSLSNPLYRESMMTSHNCANTASSSSSSFAPVFPPPCPALTVATSRALQPPLPHGCPKEDRLVQRNSTTSIPSIHPQGEI